MAKLLDDLKAVAQRIGKAVLTRDGLEVLDNRPVELPVGFERPESIQETIRRLVTDPALRAELEGKDIETFDDADDFEIPDDEPVSPHEENFDNLHLLAREMEELSGIVKPRTPEEIKASQEAIERIRKAHAKELPPKSAVEA